MVFQEVCEDVVKQTDGVLGCFLIDVCRGFAVAAAQRSGVEIEDAEIQGILRSSGDLFRGRLVEQFAKSLPTGRDSPAEFVQEVQITKVDSYQFMAAMPDWDDGIVILIAEKTLSLGFGWMIVRQTQDQLSNALRMVGVDFRRPMTGAAPSPVTHNDAIQANPPQSPLSQGQPLPDPEPSPPPAPPLPQETAKVKVEVEAAEPSPKDEKEPDRPVFTGPRAKMFRSRSGKN